MSLSNQNYSTNIPTRFKFKIPNRPQLSNREYTARVDDDGSYTVMWREDELNNKIRYSSEDVAEYLNDTKTWIITSVGDKLTELPYKFLWRNRFMGDKELYTFTRITDISYVLGTEARGDMDNCTHRTGAIMDNINKGSWYIVEVLEQDEPSTEGTLDCLEPDTIAYTLNNIPKHINMLQSDTIMHIHNHIMSCVGMDKQISSNELMKMLGQAAVDMANAPAQKITIG